MITSEKHIQNIFEKGNWYHCVQFNEVTSNGTFDYTELVSKLNFPSIEEKTVLDVGCSDGFFSKYFIQDLKAKKVTGVDYNEYDGSVAFEVLNSKRDNYVEKYSNNNDFRGSSVLVNVI